MVAPLLEIQNLSTHFRMEDGEVRAADGVSLTIHKGEILALVGESGSGKSVMALSVLRLLPYPKAYHPGGNILFDGQDILAMKKRALQQLRGNKIAMIFQEPMSSLNPLHTIERQIGEIMLVHQGLSRMAAREKTIELLKTVGLEGLTTRLHAYPHELSGGQRQRVMIAMALANDPELLIADEPTTALDVTVQKQILSLLKKLQKERNMAMLMITHDLTLVRKMADHVAVMKDGKIVETAEVKRLFSHPEHSYTKHLLASEPKGTPHWVGMELPLLTLSGITVRFPIRRGGFGLVKDTVRAVNSVSVTINKGQTLGIVGESGSGKSTLALALLRLIKSEGSIIFEGQELQTFSFRALRQVRKQLQIVFQDPYASLNPRLSIAQIISEGLRAHDLPVPNEMVDNALVEVGLDPSVKERYPHEFSGGQRQRIAIARALIIKPQCIVFDEPTSALDLSVQADILALLKQLQVEKGLTYIFISHDLRVIKTIAHDIIVMKEGDIVEQGTNKEIFNHPKTDYTKALIGAAFHVEAA